MTARSRDSQPVAVVTGATSGIGAAVAHRLQRAGYAVIGLGRLSDLTGGDRARNDDIEVFDVDVRDESAVATALTTVTDRYARLDTIVTAAGIQLYGTVADTSVQEWDDVFAVNVRGAFIAIKHAIPALRAGGGGTVVVVSSVQAFVTQNEVAAYSAGKAALNALARSIAVDEAAHGIRANAVCPGSIDTPMLQSAAQRFGRESGIDPDELLRQWGQMHPWGRTGRADEVADAVAWLAGPESGFVTGTSVPVDGGLLAVAPVRLPQ